MFAVFLFFVSVLFFISCYCCLFLRVVYFLGEGAGFVRRGVVVGGGFRPLRALRTLRPGVSRVRVTPTVLRRCDLGLHRTVT